MRTTNTHGTRIATLAALLVAGAVSPRAQAQVATAAAVTAAPLADGQRDFDFEFGRWDAHLRRLVDPLSGSHEWVEYRGLSVVNRVWDGRANLGEIMLEGPGGRIVGLSLRLYDPKARQWSIRWSNSADGALGPPMIGGFRDGRGEFYNQEEFRGRAVFVRFIFSDITPTTFRLEQAFSADGGTTWEPNWITTFTRRAD